ncbi:MAG: glycosyltransferase family 39 protein [Nanoarchaeota archaeon]
MIKEYFKNILRDYRLLLLLIILLGLSLRLLFFSGMGVSDDLSYSRYAYGIGKGIDEKSTLTLATRLGIIYPTALAYSLFGVNDFTSVIFVLLTSIGNIILIFYLGKLLFNEKIGLMGALLMSIFPLEVVNATKLLTDVPSAFFMAFGVYVFLYAEKKIKPFLYYLISGILIGIGYLIRESALLIVLFFVIYIIHKRHIKKEYFFVPIGLILIFGIEFFLLYKLTGNPIYRFTTVQDFLLDAYIRLDYFGRLRFPQGLLHYPYVILINSIISYFYIFIFISIIYFVSIRKRDAYLLLFWFIPLLLYLSFGSASIFRYLPFKADPRYLSIITLPGMLLIALFLSEKGAVIKKIVMPAALTVLIIASIGTVHANKERNLLKDLREVYPFLKNIENTIYMDKRSMHALNYIDSYENSVKAKEYPKEMGSLNNVHIVVNRWMIRNLKESNSKLEFPKELDGPPKNWKVIKQIGLEKENAIVVYNAQ